MIVEDKCKFVLSKVPVAQKRYTCEPNVNKRHLIALFSARLTGKQNSIVDFCQSNVIKCTFGMETGEKRISYTHPCWSCA